MPEDGTFVSGGLEDGALVAFDANYQLIGAGATLPFSLGSVRRVLKRTYRVEDAEEGARRYFHLLAGTTSNCVAEVSFRTDGVSTAIHDLEVETLVQGHAGEVMALADVPSADQFLSGGGEGALILWDAIAHKAIWSSGLTASVNTVAASSDGSTFAAGLANGIVLAADFESKHLEPTYEIGEAVDVVSFSPDGATLAVAAHDNQVHILRRKEESNDAHGDNEEEEEKEPAED